MATCNKCGAQVSDGEKFCSACGAAMEVPNTQAQAPSNPQMTVPPKKSGFDVNAILNTPDETASYDAADVEKNKVLSLFSYIGILVLIPIFAAKDSRYARFHANQGLALLIVAVLIGVVGAILGMFLGVLSLIPVIGLIFTILSVIIGIVFGLLGLCCFVLMILGIINAVTGKAKQLPLIGGIKILQ